MTKEDIYNVFGLKEADIKAIESSNKASIELQVKTFEEKYLRKLRVTNG